MAAGKRKGSGEEEGVGDDAGEPNPSTKPRVKRKRITPEQLAILEPSFDENDTPNHATREELAARTGMTNREVQVWAQNRRAKRLRTQNAQLRAKRETSAASSQPQAGPSSSRGESPAYLPAEAPLAHPASTNPGAPHQPSRAEILAQFNVMPVGDLILRRAAAAAPERLVRPDPLEHRLPMPKARPMDGRPLLPSPRTDHLHLRPGSPAYDMAAFLPPPTGIGVDWPYSQQQAASGRPGSSSSATSTPSARSIRLPGVAALLPSPSEEPRPLP